jgi:hypothetical protein
MKPCCQVAENLEAQTVKPDLVVKVCRACGCRHFELTVDPGQLGLKGHDL